LNLVVALLFVGGTALRLFDLTDPPLDFQAWRQLRSASIARGMYFQHLDNVDPATRDLAIRLAQFEPLEPPIFESLVAGAYLLIGQEALWLARLLAILFWMLGGLVLWRIGRRLGYSWGAAFSLMTYLFLPFSVIASRSFLPDVPMTVLVVCALYAFLVWLEKPTWPSAAVAGIGAGLAILVKVFAFFPLFFAFTLGGLATLNIRDFIRARGVWLLVLFSGGIPAVFYFGIQSGSAGDYLSGWVQPFLHLLFEPGFYVDWAKAIQHTLTLPVVSLALVGLLLSKGRQRAILGGLWLGYLLFGAAIPSLIISHTYYQIVLIPIAALSLAPLVDWFRSRLRISPSIQDWLLTGLVLVMAATGAFVSARSLAAQDFRSEILGWIKMGREIPVDARLIGLTHDYNARIRYYGWRQVTQWPHVTDREMMAMAGNDVTQTPEAVLSEFERRTQGYDYFIVTLFDELERQPVLRDLLESSFPQLDGDGYLLFDLRKGAG